MDMFFILEKKYKRIIVYAAISYNRGGYAMYRRTPFIHLSLVSKINSWKPPTPQVEWKRYEAKSLLQKELGYEQV